MKKVFIGGAVIISVMAFAANQNTKTDSHIYGIRSSYNDTVPKKRDTTKQPRPDTTWPKRDSTKQK